jgi:CRP-like cAMP-binding protein
MPLSPRFRTSGNNLLDLLPADEYEFLEPHLEHVSLALKQIVHQYDVEVAHIYFPTTGLISLLTVLEEDDPIEAMTVGREGFVGASVAMGIAASPNRAICQMRGDSMRLPVRQFLDAMERGPRLNRLIHRYLGYSLRYAGQTIACNALHTIEARASRWLLAMHDQAGRDEFPLTQEFLAFMLGVRRQSVTMVSGALQNAGLIEARRGIIVIRDRTRLEESACECYAVTRRYYDKVIS